MRSDRDEAFDALIDEAAQFLTASPPPAWLRDAVRDRIERPRAAWRFGPALAGASALALAAFIVARTWSDAPSDSVGRVVSAAPDSTVSGAPARTVSAAPDTTLSRAPSAPPRRRASAMSVKLETELEPLVPPIVIEPLSVPQLAADLDSGVVPIEIEPLRIDPMISAGN